MVNFFPLSTLNVAIYKTTTYRTLEDDVDTNNQLIELQMIKKAGTITWNRLQSIFVTRAQIFWPILTRSCGFNSSESERSQEQVRDILPTQGFQQINSNHTVRGVLCMRVQLYKLFVFPIFSFNVNFSLPVQCFIFFI